MILRRFMKHVTDQNWFAVGLDVIVVIVGIFLGLQVQTWYEERANQEAGERYLAQIIEDLKYDRITSNEMMASALPVKQQQLYRIEQMVETGKPIEIEVMDVPLQADDPNGPQFQLEIDNIKTLGFSTMFSWSYPLVRTTTFDDLINGGKLALIDDDMTRFIISDYYDQSRISNSRINQRTTGFGDALYRLVGGGARTAYEPVTEDIRLRFNQSGFNPNVSIDDFIVRAQAEDFKAVLRAEINYTTFLFDMAKEQSDRTQTLLNLLEGSEK